MAILDSTLAPYVFLLAGFGVLAGFFRKVLIRFVIFLALEILFFLLFPATLLAFVNLINRLYHSFH